MQTNLAYAESPAALCAEVAKRATPNRKRATALLHPIEPTPASDTPFAATLDASGNPIVDGHRLHATHSVIAIDTPIPGGAILSTQPTGSAHHQEPYLTADTLPRYVSTSYVTETTDQIVTLHRQRQAVIKAKTKLILQAKAVVRSEICTDADFEDDDTKADDVTAFGTKRRKLTKAATTRVDDALAAAVEDPSSVFGLVVTPYLAAKEPLEQRQAAIEKSMVKLARQLPVYPWAKSVSGFGDVSFATIIGECGDIGTYKSVAAVWKRLGLAVINGQRQGNPGAGATAEEWVEHGYNRQRRSVSWNARQQVIGGMAKWRPMFGEDVRASNSLTEYQKVYAERARYESEKLGVPIKQSDKGKESYTMHVANRAHRYVEKRLIKHLYLEWRRTAATQVAAA